MEAFDAAPGRRSPSSGTTKETREEFHANGKLYMVKVTPIGGAPFYLVDHKATVDHRSGHGRCRDQTAHVGHPQLVTIRPRGHPVVGHTAVGRDELAAWLAPLAVGELVDFARHRCRPADTNHFVTTADGEWVLNYIRASEDRGTRFLPALMAHLAARGVPVRTHGPMGRAAVAALAGKPAALVNRCPGPWLKPRLDHCRAVGAALACTPPPPSARCPAQSCGAAWRAATGAGCCPGGARRGPPARRRTGLPERRDYSATCPRVIHGDLFRDNVLWREGRVSECRVDFILPAPTASFSTSPWRYQRLVRRLPPWRRCWPVTPPPPAQRRRTGRLAGAAAGRGPRLRLLRLKSGITPARRNGHGHDPDHFRYPRKSAACPPSPHR